MIDWKVISAINTREKCSFDPFNGTLYSTGKCMDNPQRSQQNNAINLKKNSKSSKSVYLKKTMSTARVKHRISSVSLNEN